MKLSQKISLILFSIIVMTGVIFGVVVERQFTSATKQGYQYWGNSLATAVSQSVLGYTITGNKRKTHDALRRIAEKSKLINYIVIVGFDGEIFTYAFNKDLPLPLLTSADNIVERLEDALPEKIKRNNQHIRYTMIENLSANIHIGLDSSFASDQLDKQRVLIAGFILLLSVTGIAVALYIGRRLGGPVRQLTELIDLFGRDKLQEIPHFSSVDPELSELHHSFVSMVSERRELEKSQRELDQLNRDLEYRRQVSEATNLAKDEFIASMSHELRTPLTAIIGNSELIAEKVNNPELRELINSIEMAGRGQLALVNDILDMSKIDSGKFTIDEAPYDFAQLLRDVEHMLSSRADHAQLEFLIEQTNRENHQLIGDRQRIGQILINLIGNAIKFTEMGTVSLTTHTKNGYLFFTVRDSGIGMSPETIDKLFQPFQQADGSISRRFGGSGLGLYISLNLAELMGGEIDVSSLEGVGSVFELVLPYHPSNLPVEPKKREDGATSTTDKTMSGHVLVAEDTPELQMLVRRILEGMGITVTIANNGRETVDIATSHPFDLILMDMQMPVMDGIEATKTLRAMGNLTPIIALTANVMQKHRDQFDEAGGDDFLAKPIDKQELRRTLKRYLKSPVQQPGISIEIEKPLREVEWSDSYSVGHQGMDKQHQVLISYINDLVRYSSENDPAESHLKMLEILPKLNDYIDVHFRSEELLLSMVNYPNLNNQIDEHEKFRDQISAYYNSKMDYEQMCSLTKFLFSWLISHILVDDMAYKDYVKEVEALEIG